MAKASIEYKDIQVNLLLNENELKLLFTVLGYVGGCPDTSPRKYADDIYQSIRDLKLNIGNWNHMMDNSIRNQGIVFK